MIIFALGIIIGLLINPIKAKVSQVSKENANVVKLMHGQTKFMESVSGKERFKNANNIGDLTNE